MPLTMHDGVLLLGEAVLRPTSGRLAFTYGPTSLQVMRGAGFPVEAKGSSLRYQGARLVPVVSTSAAPSAPVALPSWPLPPTLAPTGPGQR